jgi:hypothetical protein
MGSALKYLLAFIALFVLAIPISTKTLVADIDSDTQKILDEYQQQAEARQWSNDLIAYANTLQGTPRIQCVLGIRKYFGDVSYQEINGSAISNKPNTNKPEIGSVIILRLSEAGHVGRVLHSSAIDPNTNLVTYIDWNGGSYYGKGTIRTIREDDPRIIGYKIIK